MVDWIIDEWSQEHSMYNGRKGCALDDTKEVPRAGAVETRAAVISGCVACSWPPRTLDI